MSQILSLPSMTSWFVSRESCYAIVLSVKESSIVRNEVESHGELRKFRLQFINQQSSLPTWRRRRRWRWRWRWYNMIQHVHGQNVYRFIVYQCLSLILIIMFSFPATVYLMVSIIFFSVLYQNVNVDDDDVVCVHTQTWATLEA